MENDNYNKMDLPVYKLVINEEDETGVNFVSLVTSPATIVTGKHLLLP